MSPNDKIYTESKVPNFLALDAKNWKVFRFGDLISGIYKAKAINKDELTIASDTTDSIRYITRTAEDNGCEMLAVRSEIPSNIIEAGNAISIGDTTATCFYQDEEFITGDHMVIVRADSWLNKYTGLFVVAILQKEQYKYSYGRAYLMDRVKDTLVQLPADCNGNPNWELMEDYIKLLYHKPLTTKNKHRQVPKLNVHDWKEFRVGDIFDIHPTRTIDGVNADDCVSGGTPLVVNKSDNNGVAGMCDFPPTEKRGIITFSDTWEGNTFFFQPDDFIGFAHVQGMYPKVKNLTDECLLFICTLLEFEARGRYSYGRKKRRDIISEVMFKLPSDPNGNPDWKFMRDYIKALPYGDRLEG